MNNLHREPRPSHPLPPLLVGEWEAQRSGIPRSTARCLRPRGWAAARAFVLGLLVLLGTTLWGQSPQVISQRLGTPLALATQRAIVVLGGWSNVPEDFLEVDTVLVQRLAKKIFVANENWPSGGFRNKDGGGTRYLLLARHLDPFGDITTNARHEVKQIVQFLDMIRRNDPTVDTSFDLVGFSMGGLVARSIVLEMPAELGHYHVKNLICMGTPNHGVSPVIAGGGVLWKTFTGKSPIGVGEMGVLSPFLVILNSKTIPASVRVSTNAGSAFVDAKVPVHPHDLASGPCTHRLAKCTHEVRVGPIVKKAHFDGTCFEHVTDQNIQIPCVHGFTNKRTEIGADGLVRILSVQLNNREAANLGPQHVIKDMWHTGGTMDLARSSIAGQPITVGGNPVPRPFINALGCSAEKVQGNPPPITGVGIVAPWFFSKGEVVTKLQEIMQ